VILGLSLFESGFDRCKLKKRKTGGGFSVVSVRV